MSGTLKQLLDRLDFLESHNKSLEETCANLRRDNTRLAQERYEALSDLMHARRDLHDGALELADLKGKHAEMGETLQKVSRDEVSHLRRASSLETELADAELKRDGALELADRRLAHIHRQNRDIDEKANTIGLQQKRIEDLESALNKCTQNRHELQTAFNKCTQTNGALIEENEDLKRKIGRIQDLAIEWFKRAATMKNWLYSDAKAHGSLGCYIDENNLFEDKS